MSKLKVSVDSRDHQLGPVKALTTLVKYADFECSYCIAAHRVVKKILQAKGDTIRYVFRHFPLTQIHSHALSAARAAEAAGRQGQFWGMHDLLFENPGKLLRENLMAHAESLSLDFSRFESDMFSEETVAKIQSDADGGVESGVTGTPAFFVNGNFFKGDWRTDLAKACA